MVPPFTTRETVLIETPAREKFDFVICLWSDRTIHGFRLLVRQLDAVEECGSEDRMQ